MIDCIEINKEHYNFMLNHVEMERPFEACGLIAGSANMALKVVSISNILKSPVRFRMDPQEQIQAFIEFEAQGWELLAIYHSHPDGPAHPSPTDLAEVFYPQTLQIIWSRLSGVWKYHAYRLVSGKFQGASVVVRD